MYLQRTGKTRTRREETTGIRSTEELCKSTSLGCGTVMVINVTLVLNLKFVRRDLTMEVWKVTSGRTRGSSIIGLKLKD